MRTRSRLTMLLRPVATETDLARLFSSLFPWSGREGGTNGKDEESQLEYNNKSSNQKPP